MGAHDLFVFISCGEVELSRYCLMGSKPDTIYTLPSSLTGATAEMIDYLKKKNFDSDSPLYIAEFLMHQMYEKMEYRKGATNVSTSAREAFESGKGVCQDFAHILIAMCRQCGIFARYVNGFMAGEGETHAWVEIWDNGFWYGFDPTNNCRIDYGYIKLAHGRDAADCPVNRGIFTGNAIQHSEIRVRVEERPLYQL